MGGMILDYHGEPSVMTGILRGRRAVGYEDREKKAPGARECHRQTLEAGNAQKRFSPQALG